MRGSSGEADRLSGRIKGQGRSAGSHRLRPNDLEFCCRTLYAATASVASRTHYGNADSGNSMLDGFFGASLPLQHLLPLRMQAQLSDPAFHFIPAQSRTLDH